MEITRLLFGFLVLGYFDVGWAYYAIGIVCLVVAGIYLYRTGQQKTQVVS